MTMFNRTLLLRRATAPWLWLFVTLFGAAVLAVCPPHWTVAIKQWAAVTLAPGQRAAARVESTLDETARHWGLGRLANPVPAPRPGLANGAGAGMSDAAVVSRLTRHVEELEAEVRRLRAESAASALFATAGATRSAGSETDQLLAAQLVSARVLGYQARRFLARRAMLDVGSDAGLENGAVVVDAAEAERAMPLLDVGGDAGLRVGRPVLAGRNVVGKLREVGRFTSTVERVTDASYRDLVRLAHLEDGRVVPGPRGVLFGTGDSLCRIRHVEASQPVAIGDVVLAGGFEGIVNAPPRYGTVVRVEQSAGGPYWEIWMQPAMNPRDLSEVAVLRTDVSAPRVVQAH